MKQYKMFASLARKSLSIVPVLLSGFFLLDVNSNSLGQTNITADVSKPTAANNVAYFSSTIKTYDVPHESNVAATGNSSVKDGEFLDPMSFRAHYTAVVATNKHIGNGVSHSTQIHSALPSIEQARIF
jgi:hypothetical protein